MPLLLVVDGLERLVPPLDANEDNEVGGLIGDDALFAWLPAPLPPGVCALLTGAANS